MHLFKYLLSAVFILASYTVLADEEAELQGFELTEDNFDSVVNGSKSALIKFYAPWCGHCQAMADDYRRLHKIISKLTDQIVVANVNADKYKSLGSRFSIGGYPTLLWFPKGGDVKDPVKYNRGRDFQSMLRFIQDNAGIKLDIAEDRKYSEDVTLKTLQEHAKTKNVFVEFYAPWCGHCKNFMPSFEKIAAAFKNEKSCLIAKLDGSTERDASEQYGIKGFPTFKFISQGSTEAEDYSGPRDVEGIVKFLNEKCGAHRRSDGSLLPEAGIIEEFEKLGKDIILAKSATKQQFQPLVDQLRNKYTGPYIFAIYRSAGDFYAKLLTKILLDASYAFISAELKRIEAILKTGAVNEQQADEFNIRKNILARFVSIVEAAGDVYLKDMKPEH